MRIIVGLATGCALALVIACGAGAKSSRTPGAAVAPAATDGAAGMPAGDSRGQIDGLDQQITAAMGKLGEARPTPPPTACVSGCEPQQMSSAGQAAVAPDPTCKPGKGDTCTQSCTLKDSICTNAGRICEIASQLGGNDAYANDKCNSGVASCEAAKKRCCSCV
jgi:hypothetical protein